MATKLSHRMIAAAREAEFPKHTQAQLAERMSELSGETWTRSQVAALENGNKSFTTDILLLVAKAQDRPLDWYLDTSGVMLRDDIPGYLTRALADPQQPALAHVAAA